MIRLPLDRDLTPEERRGFSMACAAIAQFGGLMGREPIVAGPASEALRETRRQGRFVATIAIAFDRQLGMGALERPGPGRVR
ncbi:hypothetical protein MASR1M32_10250 [Rhodobacter sp.]